MLHFQVRRETAKESQRSSNVFQYISRISRLWTFGTPWAAWRKTTWHALRKIFPFDGNWYCHSHISPRPSALLPRALLWCHICCTSATCWATQKAQRETPHGAENRKTSYHLDIFFFYKKVYAQFKDVVLANYHLKDAVKQRCKYSAWTGTFSAQHCY